MAKAARVSTPVGAGITGIGLAKDFYRKQKNEKQEAIDATEATLSKTTI